MGRSSFGKPSRVRTRTNTVHSLCSRPDCVSSSRIAMFADDTKCFRPIRTCSDVGTLQKDLDALSAWVLQNELSFQPAKCENLRVTRKRNSPSKAYTLNGVTLKRVESVRDPRVLVTQDLSWNEHVRYISLRQTRYSHFVEDTAQTAFPMRSKGRSTSRS